MRDDATEQNLVLKLNLTKEMTSRSAFRHLVCTQHTERGLEAIANRVSVIHFRALFQIGFFRKLFCFVFGRGIRYACSSLK